VTAAGTIVTAAGTIVTAAGIIVTAAVGTIVTAAAQRGCWPVSSTEIRIIWNITASI
jgi:hypothetical protein